MRKLFLVNYRFKTGEVEYSDYRLVSIETIDGATDEQQLNAAAEVFKSWFANMYPESEYLSIVTSPTIEG